MKHYVLLLTVAMALVACNSQTKVGKSVEGDYKGELFGETFKPQKVITYDALLKEVDGKEKVEAIVRGKVDAVCQTKGCWMNIVSDNDDREMFVKFKDYGFFMPKDCSGREVVMKGYAFTEVTSVDELRHYAEDEGKSQEEINAITDPVEELKFIASGVILLDQ